jgi:hypothetical protein
MRRLLCAATGGALLLLGAGCSAGGLQPGAAPPAATPAVPGPAASGPVASGPAAPGTTTPSGGASAGPGTRGGGDAALSGNSAAICEQAAKTSADAARNFALDLKLLIEAESAQDAGRVAKAKAKTVRDVENFSYALADMAKLASEPGLKQALAEMGRQVTALKGDVRKVDAGQLARLQDTLDRACGKD